jgi:hypothetical protein
MRKYYDIMMISIIAVLLIFLWQGQKNIVETKVIEFKINVDEIDRAITEIEGGLDRMIDSVNKLGEK